MHSNLNKSGVSSRLLFALTFTLYMSSVFIFAPSRAMGTTYNVKKDGTGDFITIKAAVDQAVAGDIILVHSGDYTSEGRIVFASGTEGAPGNPIVIRAYPRRTVVMGGFSTLSRGTSTIGNSYIHIEGFHITNSTQGWNGGGILIWGHGIEVIDNYIYNVPSYGIAGHGYVTARDVRIASNHIYMCNAGMSVDGEDWVIEFNEIERVVYNNQDADYMRAFGNNHHIRNNYMHGTQLAEVGASHTDGLQTYGSGGGLHNSIIENNIYLNYHQGFLSRSDAVGSSNLIFRNNVYDNRGWTTTSDRNGQGITTGGGENISMINNVFIGHQTGARFFEDSNPATVSGIIKNNIFINNELPISFPATWETQAHNVSYGHNIMYQYGRIDSYTTNDTDIIDVDPQLLNINNLVGDDGKPITLDDGYQLQAGSIAINKGENLTTLIMFDIFGNPRPRGVAIDIGAHEITVVNGLIQAPSSLKVQSVSLP